MIHSKTFEGRLRIWVKSQKLFTLDDIVLLAVSGGVDSIVMLHALRATRLAKTIVVAHINHGLRGKVSDRDEEFVKRLAKEFGYKFFSGHVDVKSRVHAKKESVEEAARNLRYDSLERIRKRAGAQVIATAHTANDNAETVIMNLVRGAGVRGASGIAPKRGVIVRPLLFATKEEVEAYARAKNIPWREDKTNRSRTFTRNRVRLDVIPELEKINPKAVQHLHDFALRLRSKTTREEKKTSQKFLSIAKKKIRAGEKISTKNFTISIEQIKTRPHSFPKNPNVEYIDAALVGKNFIVRSWREGDAFHPLGMKGKMKLSDYFINKKIPREERPGIPVLTTSKGEIVWVCGMRLDERFKITKASKSVYKIVFKEI